MSSLRSPVRFVTVPWAPGLEAQQVDREVYTSARLAAVVWQLGIRKGFEREAVKARLLRDPTTSTFILLAIELGMFEAECSALAEEFGSWRTRAEEFPR